MVEPAETLRRPKEEKTPEEKRKKFKVIKGGGRKGWGPGAKAGAIVGSTAVVVSGVAAALGEIDNLPDPLQGFYDKVFHPSKVAEEKSDQALRGKYDVKEANEDLAKIVNETKTETEIPPVVEETPEDSALEAILQEKVSFISEALPGAELNTKTGELTAKAGNEWGIKEGESIGWYVVNAFKMETADGVEEEQDAIGLVPKVIEAIQNKIFEEKGEKQSPILINLKETEGVKITELKINSGFLPGVSSFGMNIPVGTIIYAPLTTELGFYLFDPITKVETKDKCVTIAYESDANNTSQLYMNFVEGKMLPDLKRTDVFPLEDGELLMNIYKVKLGDPLVEITGSAFLDETANKFDELWLYEKTGQYQFNLIHWKNIFDKGHEVKTIELLDLKSNQETEKIKVFILPNEPAHEQTK